MTEFVSEILDNMNEGITILADNQEIIFWNNYMEGISETDKSMAIGKNIYEIIPNLNKHYFINGIDSVLKDGNEMFFSAAMHKNILNSKDSLNLKISRLKKDDKVFLLLEFINVTNQIAQINQLKDRVNELYLLNQQLNEKEKIIKKLAYYDNLTGAANRTLFYKIANKYLKKAKDQNSVFGLVFIDIDHFKDINDNYGHLVGDKILVRVANILQESVGPNDLVVRYGGDEFLILLENAKQSSDYEEIISKICNSDNRVLSFSEFNVNISLSMGVSFYPNDGDTIDRLLAKADNAMYITKNNMDMNI